MLFVGPWNMENSVISGSPRPRDLELSAGVGAERCDVSRRKSDLLQREARNRPGPTRPVPQRGSEGLDQAMRERDQMSWQSKFPLSLTAGPEETGQDRTDENTHPRGKQGHGLLGRRLGIRRAKKDRERGKRKRKKSRGATKMQRRQIVK